MVWTNLENRPATEDDRTTVDREVARLTERQHTGSDYSGLGFENKKLYLDPEGEIHYSVKLQGGDITIQRLLGGPLTIRTTKRSWTLEVLDGWTPRAQYQKDFGWLSTWLEFAS